MNAKELQIGDIVYDRQRREVVTVSELAAGKEYDYAPVNITRNGLLQIGFQVPEKYKDEQYAPFLEYNTEDIAVVCFLSKKERNNLKVYHDKAKMIDCNIRHVHDVQHIVSISKKAIFIKKSDYDTDSNQGGNFR